MTLAHAPHRHAGLRKQLPLALGLIAAAMLTGLVFAAWLANGPALLYALAANGLAWCL
ncbi:MAG: hypothetical protein Q8K28_06375 [Hoeflea sp.]|uniref:hypothetical protein n=1 Tax=Hoeflea sp. TaxID=1940281 RepID=UPI0027311721|nr:hypothetical protein [Hoeflea sp.]MDP2119513.1 hypothetical protein [Hoeflea sp.]